MSNDRTARAAAAADHSARTRFIAILSVLGILLSGSIVAVGSDAAWAKTKYPSWSDVVQARNNVKFTNTKLKELRGLLVKIEADVERTAADADKKGNEYQKADEAYFAAADRTDQLQQQADKAATTAKKSELHAGQLAAQLARTGSSDLSLNLFFDGEHAGNLLANMGQAKKVSQQANSVYDRAVRDRNTAQALTDQADVAEGILKGLKAKAEAALAAAQAASDAANAALAESTSHKAELEAQVAALTTKKKQTEKDYLKGVAIARKAAEKAAALAAKRAHRAYAGMAAVGLISSTGWAKPAYGYISSGFGPRIAPVPGALPFHSGTDLAGGCGIPIYAAHSGTVIYAGHYGTYGNWVLVDNGGGIQTGYAHIVDGGILVRVGQQVGTGQNIARTGMTGAANGCHLHFEVRVNGRAINAVPFMRGMGIRLG